MKTIKRNLLVSSVLAALSIAPTMAFAVPPAYITDALTAATTTFTEYITAAAPGVFTITVILAGLFLVLKLLKKATH